MNRHLMVTISAALLLLPAAAMPQSLVLQNYPLLPVGQVARDLGMAPGQLRTCLAAAPGGGQQQPSKQAGLLGCVQKANPAITGQQLDTEMSRYNPAAHPVQMPQ